MEMRIREISIHTLTRNCQRKNNLLNYAVVKRIFE